ncbi:hypothetical protein VdG1_00763 [Verticillium dahliae VDG1]|nr:hypothetical protein VdG1_00763 [Verticillium dahliae VDG1]
MRLSVSAILALPLFAAAAENQFEQYKAQFQTYLDQFSSYIPNPNRYDAADAHEAKTGAKKLSILTLDNWEETLYSTVQPSQTTPEEWWLLITGRNKTCYNQCGPAEVAFNATAENLWAIDLLPPGNKVDIWARRINGTTVTSQTLVDLHAAHDRADWHLLNHAFHPFNSWIAEHGLSVPVGYFIWFFATVPNWAVMLLVSFASRRMMNRRMAAGPNPPRA